MRVARNFAAHPEHRVRAVPQAPLLFLNPLPTLTTGTAPIVNPPACERLNYEGEVAVVMGKEGHLISEDAAMDHVWGYTVINDVTARDIQNREEAFVRAKGYDTFAPVGPCVATALAPLSLIVQTRLNGQLHPHAPLTHLVHPTPHPVPAPPRPPPHSP